jgi:hypothetical protein
VVVPYSEHLLVSTVEPHGPAEHDRVVGDVEHPKLAGRVWAACHVQLDGEPVDALLVARDALVRAVVGRAHVLNQQVRFPVKP